MSLGLSAWTVVVLLFRDAFAVFRLRVLSVGAGELAFLDCGATDLAFLRGLRRVITKVDSKLRSLESPVCFRLGERVRLGINMVSVKNCGFTVFTPLLKYRLMIGCFLCSAFHSSEQRGAGPLSGAVCLRASRSAAPHRLRGAYGFLEGTGRGELSGAGVPR